MTNWIDAHHHLWDLDSVHYPWLMANGVKRFFGDPAPIQRDYLLDEFRKEASAEGFVASVHIQVGAESGWEEAQWVQAVADANPDWPIAQVVFCDLNSENLATNLNAFQDLPTVRGVRQIIGRAPGEDAQTGTNDLLNNPMFVDGLKEAGRRGLSFDLQLIPELMEKTARVLEAVPETPVALCHAGSPHDRSLKGIESWAQSLKSLSDLPHVYCKLSGLGMFANDWEGDDFRPIIDVVLEEFGADRVMFGSNFPVDKLYSSYASLVDAYRDIVPNSMHEAVFRTTAARFYAL